MTLPLILNRPRVDYTTKNPVKKKFFDLFVSVGETVVNEHDGSLCSGVIACSVDMIFDSTNFYNK